MSTFHVKINNGPEQVITQKSGLYWLAVAHALATLDYEPDHEHVVKIWVPHLAEAGHGPYYYACDGHTIGKPSERPTW